VPTLAQSNKGNATMAGTPDHPIDIVEAPGRLRITFAGRVIADTTRALDLREASYAPVVYLPREDVDMTLLKRTDHKTRCPYKGEASYYSIAADGSIAENAAWSYEQPLADVAEIAFYVAFYASRVDRIERFPA
jgi:uncharacterized protein (DUF427 family)